MEHKAGFVNILGKPNAGKSTLMNNLVHEKLSVITPKAQTTRHRIMGIVSGDDYQIVYSDTPGYLKPKYGLHKSMMHFVESALQDADLILYVIDLTDEEFDPNLTLEIANSKIATFVILNKIDAVTPEVVEKNVALWKENLPEAKIFTISALNNKNIDGLSSDIIATLPDHPAYYDKEELTDKSERFFASEIVRGKIFENYMQEIPYSSEVVINSFKNDPEILRIEAEIYIERDTQKGIIIGHKGSKLKKTGTEARLELEAFFGKKVFLGLHVKVKPNWRNDQRLLNYFGYTDK